MSGMVHFYIGLEGVSGRWRLGVISDVNGCVLNAVRLHSGVALHTIPRSELRPKLFDLVRNLLAGVRLPSIDATFHLCIGLTGVSFPYDSEIDLSEAIAEMPWLRGEVELLCTGDAEIAFASHAKSNTGTAIVCHAGSVAYAVVDGKPSRFGGWGPAFGDLGSGYAMGRALLQQISKYYDAQQLGIEDTSFAALWRRVDRWLETPGADDDVSATFAGSFEPLPEWNQVAVEWKRVRRIITDVYGEVHVPSGLFALAHRVIQEYGASVWWSIVSSLAIPLFDAWREERAAGGAPSVATELVVSAARELAEQYRRLRHKLSAVLDTSPLVLTGGICNHNREFRECLLREIRRCEQQHGEVLTKDSQDAARPVIGALLLALGGSTWGNLRLPAPNVIATVERTAADFPESLAND